MSAWVTLRGWLRSRPLVADSLLALVVLASVLFGRGPDGTRYDAIAGGPGTIVLGTVAAGALVLRRRWPVAVLVVALAAGAFAIMVADGPSTAVIPTFVALYTVATCGPLLQSAVAAVVTAGVYLLASLTATQVPEGMSYAFVGWSGMSAAIGAAVRSQRQVLAAAHERAERAERSRDEEAQRRVAEERMRIAHELHDVVAHHIAVITVQAGVARHLLDDDPDRARQAVAIIRESSQAVLTELAAIVGLLRTPNDSVEPHPAPSLAQVPELVASMRAAGVPVVWTSRGRPIALEPLVDLTAYRVVQESLTNAAKHGDGPAQLTVEYGDFGVRIEVSNRIAAGVGDESDAAGYGVIGMRERVGSVGGRIDAGPDGDGRFVVSVELSQDLG